MNVRRCPFPLFFSFVSLLLASSASGQDRVPRVFRANGGVLEPARPETPVTFGFVDRSERIVVEVDGARVAATSNGASLPAARLRELTDRIEVLDAGGAVAARITLTATGGTLRTFADRDRPSLGLRLVPTTRDGTAPPAATGASTRPLRLVAAVTAGLGAEAAGMRAGDLVFEIDSGPVDEARLRTVLAGRRAGERVRLRAFRREEVMEFDVELRPAAAATAAPADAAAATPIELRDGMLVVLGGNQREPAPPVDAAGDAALRAELRAVRERLQRLEAVLEEIARQGK